MNCIKCGRTIRPQSSTAGRMGYGPKCYRMVLRATRVLSEADDSRAWRAVGLLLNPVNPVERTWNAKVWRVPGRTGLTSYLTHPSACSCPAGRYSHGYDDHYCYHRLAIAVLAA